MIIATAAITGVRVLGHSAQAAPPVSMVLYWFKDGTTGGWRAGANVASVAAVTSFADGPSRPGISVSFTGIGSTVPWYPHFQIDDVGYTT